MFSLDETEEGYKVDLQVFEGPLDLLLHLIRKDELDIYDIPIGEITRQYLDYLDTMKRLDITLAGEFLVMAATLTLIKSRSLLPSEGTASGEDEEEDDPRLELVRQLVEYKKYKDATRTLLSLESRQSEKYLPGGKAALGDSGGFLSEEDLSVTDILKAFREILKNRPVPPTGHLKPIVWSVPEKIELILGKIKAAGRIPFTALFPETAPNGEIIVTFLALLELVKRSIVSAIQESEFSEITITQNGDAAR